MKLQHGLNDSVSFEARASCVLDLPARLRGGLRANGALPVSKTLLWFNDQANGVRRGGNRTEQNIVWLLGRLQGLPTVCSAVIPPDSAHAQN